MTDQLLRCRQTVTPCACGSKGPVIAERIKTFFANASSASPTAINSDRRTQDIRRVRWNIRSVAGLQSHTKIKSNVSQKPSSHAGLQSVDRFKGGKNDANNVRYADWNLAGLCGDRDGTVQRRHTNNAPG